MSVLQLDDVKKHLNITVDTYDLELPVFIGAAEAAIARRVGPLEPTSTVSVVTGCAGILILPAVPVAALTSVVGADATSVNVARLNVGTAGIVSYADGRTAFYSPSYTVTYDAGYDPLPADLALATLEMVRHLWVTQRGSGQRPGSQASTELSNTLPGSAYALPIRVQQLIAPYAITPGYS